MIFVFFSTNCASYFWYFKEDFFVKFSQRFVFDRHKALEMKPCSHFCVFYSLPVNQNWSRRPFDMFPQCLARLNEMSNLDYWQQNMLCNKYFLLKIVTVLMSIHGNLGWYEPNNPTKQSNWQILKSCLSEMERTNWVEFVAALVHILYMYVRVFVFVPFVWNKVHWQIKYNFISWLYT